MTLCAHCVNERDDCEVEEFDGKQVQMCFLCREGPIRGGCYTFADQGCGDSWKMLKTTSAGTRSGNRRCPGGGVSIGARQK